MNDVINIVPEAGALMSFCSLITPLSLQEFVRTYWTRAPLHISRQSDSWYKNVVTLGDIETLLLNERLPVELFRLIKDGNECEPPARRERISVSKTRPTTVADTRELIASLSRGYTIEIDATQRVLPTLMRFVDAIVNETRMTASTKVYITPATATGFRVHYDLPDVFTLQLAGTKRWTVYPQIHRYVSAAQYPFMFEECRSPGDPIAEFDLRPGDLLYVPSGMPHSASAETSASISVAIGLTPLRWFDLFDEMKELAMWEDRFREHIPTHFTCEADYDRAIEDFRRLLSAFVQKLNASKLVRDRIQRFVRAYPTSTHAETLRQCLGLPAQERS